MKLNTKTVLIGYGAFAVVNWGLAYVAARRPAGSSALLDFNNRLLAFNVLARLFPPPLPSAPVAAGQPAQLTASPPAMGIDQGSVMTYNA